MVILIIPLTPPRVNGIYSFFFILPPNLAVGRDSQLNDNEKGENMWRNCVFFIELKGGEKDGTEK